MVAGLILRNTGRDYQENLENDVDSPVHQHTFWSMEMCDEGKADIFIGKEKLPVKRGDIIIIGPNIKHHFCYRAHTTFGSYSFKFDLSTAPSTKALLKNDADGLPLRMALIEAVKLCYAVIFPVIPYVSIAVDDNVPEIHMLEYLLYGIIRRYLLEDIAIEVPSHGIWLRQRIVSYVFQKGGRPVSVEEVAEHLKCSAGHLRLMTRRELNCSPKNIIDAERIRIMKNLLQYSDLRIEELIDQLHFPDKKYGTFFFRRHTGMSMRDYRKKVRKINVG